MTDVVFKIFYDAVLSAAPIVLCVLGGMFAHKANVLNIALEGMMLLGAFFTCLFTIYSGNYALALLGATAICLAVGLVFGFFAVTRKGNPIIVGLAVNLFASAITAFTLQAMGRAELVAAAYKVAETRIHIPLVKDVPFLGRTLSGHTPLTYGSYVAILLLWALMFRTRFGVHVRVVGENEEAARSVGIRTEAVKYGAVLLGAGSCAFAGAVLSMDELGGIFTKDMTAGRGFIAIAAIFCGKGKPLASALYAVAFGLARSLALNLGIYAGSGARLFNALPYIVIVGVLAAASALKNRNNHTRGFLNE